eukprot:gnl/MRDRNA2_/MRDRNA2_88016_c0_seq1.p1 gnl/MRDRNA2_/MRDRNA2_88016_c0~~gnl/MRDRNA2_/MRDRNA2_88016_c0_seq1.p1  ORF type:complete len:110 (+),score=32.58 gnl/MRDRNA2_/MRDRNA2_88016_c0_seq1:67-396(+)
MSAAVKHLIAMLVLAAPLSALVWSDKTAQKKKWSEEKSGDPLAPWAEDAQEQMQMDRVEKVSAAPTDSANDEEDESQAQLEKEEKKYLKKQQKKKDPLKRMKKHFPHFR